MSSFASQPALMASPPVCSVCSRNSFRKLTHCVASKYMKHKLTLWHEMRPRSSSTSRILWRISCRFTRARHFSRPRDRRSFTHMHRKMAAAFRNSHPTPRANRATPCSPEKSRASKTVNANRIQQTRMRL